MANLYCDLGNTALKIYSPEKKKVFKFDALMDQWIKPIEEFIAGNSIDRVVVASVAVNSKLQELLSLFQLLDVQIVSSDSGEWQIKHCYRDPKKLGIDRLLAMEAAYRMVNASVVVVDCGSAITVDAVSEEGFHIGGYIVPGFRIQMESLSRDTSLIFDHIEPEMNFGQDTSSCIRNGSLRMVHALCESVIKDVKPKKVFVTGGDLKGALADIGSFGKFDELLVFKGMEYVYG